MKVYWIGTSTELEMGQLSGFGWRTTLPTEPGWYWTVYIGQVVAVRLFEYKGELYVHNGGDMTDATLYSHWLGPIPPPEAPEVK